MKRLASFFLAAGLLAQISFVYRQAREPVSPLRESSASHFVPTSPSSLMVIPIAQQNRASDGQACVAMAVNAVTGKSLNDEDILNKYGFELLRALREECAEAGLDWRDGGEIGSDKWELVEQKILGEHLPVVLALNGPEFSVNGRGHIVLLCDLDGDRVTFADPASGTIRTTSRGKINSAPQHPHGNFFFYAEQSGPANEPLLTDLF